MARKVEATFCAAVAALTARPDSPNGAIGGNACGRRLMEPGSHACRGILFPDRLMVLNYQSDCLSTLFAWILISPNSVLTPRGECVGDVERKCACVCVCDAQ